MPNHRTSLGESTGVKRTPEYVAWMSMKSRCLNSKAQAYKYYGARGISVCDRWMHSYATFLADMGRKPSPSHSIERKDSNGPYSPENCVWGTPYEQAVNRRHIRFFTYRRAAHELDGKTLTAKEWARRFGLKYTTLLWRLNHGMELSDAVTMPITPIPARIQGLAGILSAQVQ